MTSQEIGRLAGRIFTNVLPEYLVARSQQDQEDYGIDYEIEVMLPGDRAGGVIFKVQEKGTTDLGLNAAGDQISYSDLKTARMRYYLRELRIPAALVVVDVTKRDVYWVRLQGNAEVEAAYEAAAAGGQGTMTVHLPVRNKLPATLAEFLDDMVRGQDAVMVRYLRDISSQKVLDAAGSLPDFEATVRAARAHVDLLRLEQVERTLRAGDVAGAMDECRRILPSESETAQARLAAGLNIIRLAGPMQPPPRSAEEQRTLVEERLNVTARMRVIAADRPAEDRLRLFAEFHDHLARLASRTNQLVELLDGPRPAGELASTVREISIRQLVVAVIAEFQEAYERLAGFIRGGHVELIAQSWAMLVAELLVFVHLCRNYGYDTLTTGLIAWIDATLPSATRFAESMGDWTSVVFCALQQIPLAPFGDAQEINRRAEMARSYIRRLPPAEQQRHLDAVTRQVAILMEPPPEQN